MDVNESAKGASEVLNGNINISKQIQNTNELLNFVSSYVNSIFPNCYYFNYNSIS